MVADMVIKGGVVVDGTGGPARTADVAVIGGRIAEIGRGLTGKEELDASGQVVSPGFIDIHTHYDAQVLWDHRLTPSSFHGVTTVVAGNCGFSLAPTRPSGRDAIVSILARVEDMNARTLTAGIRWDFETFPEYLSSVSRRGSLLNFAAYVGHSPLRLFVMGDDAFEREATDLELAAMCQLLREAMVAGAAGVSTSFEAVHFSSEGRPIPSRVGGPQEFGTLVGVLGELGRGVVEVSPGSRSNFELLYEWQPRVGVPFTYGGLVAGAIFGEDWKLDLHRSGWAQGAHVWPQVTPRPLQVEFTMARPTSMFNTNVAFNALSGLTTEDRRTAYRDATWRHEAADAFAGPDVIPPRWDTFEVVESPTRADLAGVRLSQLALEQGSTPLEAMLGLSLEDDLRTTFRAVIANDEPDAVAKLLRDDHCTLGLSDAGAHLGQLCDAPQATDFLGTWVRDRNVMSLDHAVRKLTGVQADLFGFADRGYLRPGAWADVVVFDPQTVGPGPLRRVRDFPADAERWTADQPTGVTHVLVNGTPIRVHGHEIDEPSRWPGQVLASGAPR